MPRSVLAFLLAVVGLSPASAAPVPAGPAPKQLDALPVPAESMLVVHLNGIDRTRERLTKMLAGVDEAFAKKTAKELEAALAEALDGRDLAGIDGTGRVFVAVGDVAQLTGPDGPVAVCVPVKDYKTFRDKFLTGPERKSFQPGKDGVDEFEAAGTDRTTYLVHKDGYVTVTPSKATAERYAGKFDKLTAKALGKAADALLGADVSLLVNLEQVNGTYGEQIQQGRQLIGLLLGQAAMGLDKQQMEAAKALLETAFQLVQDGKALVIGAEFRPEGTALRLEARFGADTETGKTVAAERPTALAALGGLPKGMMAYSATKWKLNLGKLSKEFVAAADEEKNAEAIEELTKLLADGGTDDVGVNADLRTTLHLRTLADAEKASAAMLKVTKGLTAGASYSNVLLKGRPEVTEAAEKAHGFTLHKAVLKMDFDATVEKLANDGQKEAAVASMKKLMAETVTLYFGTDGKRFVTVAAPDEKAAKALLAGVMEPKAKVSDDAAFAATRKQLPADAGMISLVDAVRGMGLLGEYLEGLAGALPGVPVDLPKMNKVTGDPVYAGVAVGLSGDTARFDLFIPVKVVKLARQAFGDE